MKVTIVIAGLIVVAAAAVMAIRPDFLKPASLAHVKKSDIFGFSPGMTFEETDRLVSQRRYRCRQGRSSYILECDINGAKVTITSDDADPKHPIRRVTAELNSPAPQDAAVRSLSEQFNSEPVKDAREGWTWIVGRGFKLTYDGIALQLTDEAADARPRKEEAKH